MTDNLAERVRALESWRESAIGWMEELEAENQRLRQDVEELQGAVNTDIDALSYEQLTKQDKVRQVRDALADEARDSANGRAAMDYKQIRWLFNGQPSPGHAYDLMALAGEADGYNYDEREAQSNRITVDLDAVKADANFHAANNATTQEAN